MNEFVKYNGGFAPYNMGCGSEHFNVLAWWRGVKFAGWFSVVPHSASVERAFSDFGWFQSKRRNRLNPDTIGKLTTIKQALHTEELEANMRHAPSASVSEESDDEEDDHQELHPGFVPDACVTEVPGQTTRPRPAL